MTCAEVRALLGGYVLQALEPEEAERVRRHVESCADCAREQAQLAPLPDLLDAAHAPDEAPEPPPAALEEAVLDRFARERPAAERPRRERIRRRLARPLPAAGLAAAAAVAVTLAAANVFDGDDGTGPKAYGAHLRAVAGGAPRQGTDAAPADPPYAYAHLSSSDSGTRVELEASGLPATPGTVYELWCVYPDGSKVSAGTFRPDGEGHATASMTTAARIGDYHHLSVEQRTPGRSGRRVLAGDIAY